jgi:hypothetical protein
VRFIIRSCLFTPEEQAALAGAEVVRGAETPGRRPGQPVASAHSEPKGK